MSRWHRRLAELRGGDAEPLPTPPYDVQNVQNVQNFDSDPGFEHFEQIEQSPKPADAEIVRAPLAERAAVVWGEAEAERAAIVEYNGSIARTWTEGFARLDPDRPLSDVPPKRWRRFVGDVGGFLDSPFCAIAAALGWEPFDLFGCDRERPFARIDQAGLLWLLNGDRLVALTEKTATIETRTGVRLTYRRKPVGPGGVLAWELARPNG